MLRKLMTGVLLAASVTALAGCGYTPGERALTGGAIGAGGGAIVGAATARNRRPYRRRRWGAHRRRHGAAAIARSREPISKSRGTMFSCHLFPHQCRGDLPHKGCRVVG